MQGGKIVYLNLIQGGHANFMIPWDSDKLHCNRLLKPLGLDSDILNGVPSNASY